jgi:hypothetical protein
LSLNFFSLIFIAKICAGFADPFFAATIEFCHPIFYLTTLKAAMKREYFSHASKDASRKPFDAQAERCIALIDARFLVWLAQHAQTGAKQSGLNRTGFAPFLSECFFNAGLNVEVQRIYWYTEESDSLDVDGQIVRKVLSHDVDGGVSLLRSLSHDLSQLAMNNACAHVLLATDDERFLTAIDNAQLTGLSVHILADEVARNMPKLHQTDPGWGRLLSQADRRMVVQPKVLAEILQGGADKEPQALPEDPEVVRQSITEVIVSWWDDEPEDKREELRDALHISRGIPQEVDRQLLLRMRHRLTRALSLQEKKMLREIFRAVALGTNESEIPPHADPLASTT